MPRGCAGLGAKIHGNVEILGFKNSRGATKPPLRLYHLTQLNGTKIGIENRAPRDAQLASVGANDVDLRRLRCWELQFTFGSVIGWYKFHIS